MYVCVSGGGRVEEEEGVGVGGGSGGVGESPARNRSPRSRSPVSPHGPCQHKPDVPTPRPPQIELSFLSSARLHFFPSFF